MGWLQAVRALTSRRIFLAGMKGSCLRMNEPAFPLPYTCRMQWRCFAKASYSSRYSFITYPRKNDLARYWFSIPQCWSSIPHWWFSTPQCWFSTRATHTSWFMDPPKPQTPHPTPPTPKPEPHTLTPRGQVGQSEHTLGAFT